MKKIGLLIRNTNSGEKNLLEINANEYFKKIYDVRSLLHCLTVKEQATCKTLSFVENGYFITIIRPIAGREGDNLAGWIYVPNDIKIEATEIQAYISYIEGIIVKDEIDSREDEIRHKFSKEYSSLYDCDIINPVNKEKNKFAVISGYTLKELLEYAYQEEYKSFETIIVIENTKEVELKNELASRITNLSTLKLEQYTILLPPTTEEINKYLLPQNISIYVDGKPFSVARQVKYKEKYEVLFKREGYTTPPWDLYISEEKVQRLSITNYFPLSWDKIIKKNFFRVYSAESGTQINRDNVTIEINGQQLSEDISLPEKECIAFISVSVSGYEGIIGRKVDFSTHNTNNPIVVNLLKKIVTKQAELSLDNGKTAKITIESKYLGNSKHIESILKGYKYNKIDERLYFDEKRDWIQRLIGFGVGVAIFSVIWAGIILWNSFGDSEDNVNNQEHVSNNTKMNPIKKADSSFDEYLNRDEWIQSEMENIPELKGLYKALIFYNKIEIEKINSKLGNNKKLSEIVELLEQTPAECDNNQVDSITTIVVSEYIKSLKSKKERNTENTNK